MPTQNIKHRMLQEARKIARKEYKQIVEKELKEDGTILTAYISPEIQFEWDIDVILEKHPEYDGTEFRNMIKKAKEILKEKEREYNER